MNYCRPALLLLSSATIAGAHPGHDLLEHGTTHLFASPFHLITFALLAITCVIAARFTRSLRLRRCLHAGTALAIVAGAAWFFSR